VICEYKEAIAEPAAQGNHFGAEDGFQLQRGVASALMGLLAFAVAEAVAARFAIVAKHRSKCRFRRAGKEAA
jgi:hypothetical protein